MGMWAQFVWAQAGIDTGVIEAAEEALKPLLETKRHPVIRADRVVHGIAPQHAAVADGDSGIVAAHQTAIEIGPQIGRIRHGVFPQLQGYGRKRNGWGVDSRRATASQAEGDGGAASLIGEAKQGSGDFLFEKRGQVR